MDIMMMIYSSSAQNPDKLLWTILFYCVSLAYLYPRPIFFPTVQAMYFIS